MLVDPPCARIFVGCDHDDSSTNVGRENSHAYSSDRSEISINNRVSNIGLDQGSSSSRSSAFSRDIAGNFENTHTQAERISQYTISVTNHGTENLKNLVFSHGPLPSGAIFRAVESSQGCNQVGVYVECTTDIDAGASQDFTISYKVPDSLSCALSRALQNVKSAVNGLSGSATRVSTSVTCAMTLSDSTSDVSSSAFESSVSTGSTYLQGSIIAVDQSGMGQEAYKQQPMPRTGGMDLAFSTMQEYVLFAPQIAKNVDFFTPMLFFVAGVVLLAITLSRVQRRVLL